MSRLTCPHCGEPLEVSKPRGPAPRYDKTEALALLRFGATPTEVAKVYGVHRQSIYDLAKREKVTT